MRTVKPRASRFLDLSIVDVGVGRDTPAAVPPSGYPLSTGLGAVQVLAGSRK
jgi:hypothetical protein